MECTTFSNKRTTQLLLRVHGYHSDRVSVGVVGPGIRRSGCVRSLANSDRRTVRPYKAYGKVFIAHSALILESERVRLTETHKPSHMLSKDPPLTHTTTPAHDSRAKARLFGGGGARSRGVSVARLELLYILHTHKIAWLELEGDN